MESNEIGEEVERFLFICSNVIKLRQYFDSSEFDEFAVSACPSNGKIISRDHFRDNNNKTNEYISIYFQKSSIMEDNSFMLSSNNKPYLEMPICFFYNIINTIINFREYFTSSEKSKSVDDLINSPKNNVNQEKSALIDKLIEETNEYIPICNCSILKELFSNSKKDCVKEVWINPHTGEFCKQQNFIQPYPRVSIYKTNGKLRIPYKKSHINEFANSIAKNEEARFNIIKSFEAIYSFFPDLTE